MTTNHRPKIFTAMAALETPDWWLQMNEDEQDAYLAEHPHSHLEKTEHADNGNKRETKNLPAHYAPGQKVGTLARVDVKDFINGNYDVIKSTPESKVLDVECENEDVQDLADRAKRQGGDPLSEDEKEKLKRPISKTLKYSLIALAAVGAIFEDSHMDGVTKLSQCAADFLLRRAGQPMMFNPNGDIQEHQFKAEEDSAADDEASSIGNAGAFDEINRIQEERRRKREQEEYESKLAGRFRNAPDIYDAAYSAHAAQATASIGDYTPEEWAEHERKQEEWAKREQDRVDATSRFYLMYALAFMKAAAQHYEAEAKQPSEEVANV